MFIWFKMKLSTKNSLQICTYQPRKSLSIVSQFIPFLLKVFFFSFLQILSCLPTQEKRRRIKQKTTHNYSQFLLTNQAQFLLFWNMIQVVYPVSERFVVHGFVYVCVSVSLRKMILIIYAALNIHIVQKLCIYVFISRSTHTHTAPHTQPHNRNIYIYMHEMHAENLLQTNE